MPVHAGPWRHGEKGCDVTDQQTQMIQWLETGIGVFSPDLAAAMDSLPADLLAARLAECGGHAGCDLAYVLARRHDPRGIASLARSATILAQAGRALRYLDQLDMLDMVPPEYRTPEARDRAAAVDLLGCEPDQLESLLREQRPWPSEQGRVEVALFRFRFPEQPAGLVLVKPTKARVDGGVARLGPDQALAMICGQSFAFHVVRVPLEQVAARQLSALLLRPPYHDLARPALTGAWRFGDELVLLVEASRKGRRGFLLGGALGTAPPAWFEADPEVEDEPLTGEQAFWLWFGQVLLDAAGEG